MLNHLRRSPSSSSSSSPTATASSRSIQEPSPRRAWMRRTSRAAAATASPEAASPKFGRGARFSMISPRSTASSENDTEDKSPKTKTRSPLQILRRRSMSSATSTSPSAVSGRVTRRRYSLLMNSSKNKSPKAASQNISPSNATTVTVEPVIATRRITSRHTLLCSNKNKSPTATSLSTSPSVAVTIATTAPAGKATRRQSLMSSKKNKSPTASSASVKTPLSKQHGMTLRSTAKKQQQRGQQEVVTETSNVSTPKSLEKEVRKSISFLTPPSQSKKQGSSTAAGRKKVYKKTPLPSRKKKTMVLNHDEKEVSPPTLVEKDSCLPDPVVSDTMTIQETKDTVLLNIKEVSFLTPGSKKKGAGRKKVYKKTPMPSRKKKTVEKDPCLPDPVVSDTTTIQETKDAALSEIIKAIISMSSDETVDAGATLESSDGGSFHDAIKGSAFTKVKLDDDEEKEAETASNTSSDSLTRAAVAAMDADDIMEAASFTEPAMDEKDASWAKLPVEGEEEKGEEELSFMEEAIALFLDDKRPALGTRSEDDSVSDEEEVYIVIDKKINDVPREIITSPKVKEQQKKTKMIKEQVSPDGQETMIKEEIMDEIPQLVASATDLETMPLSQMTEEKEDKQDSLATEMLGWKQVAFLFLGAVVLTSCLAVATQHLSLNGVCLLA